MVDIDGAAVAVRGFDTPSRKFDVLSTDVTQAAQKIGIKDDGMPTCHAVPAHQNLPADRFVLSTFKWNVPTQARTANQKYLSEIVHANPMWIHVDTAASLGIATGDWVEIITYRPLSGTRGDHAFGVNGAVVGSARVKAFVTQGFIPKWWRCRIVSAIRYRAGRRPVGRVRVQLNQRPGAKRTALPRSKMI